MEVVLIRQCLGELWREGSSVETRQSSLGSLSAYAVNEPPGMEFSAGRVASFCLTYCILQRVPFLLALYCEVLFMRLYGAYISLS